MKKKRVMSLFLVSIMILASLSMAFAAPFDLIHKTNSSKNHGLADLVDSPSVFDEVAADIGNYLIGQEKELLL